MIDNRRAVRVEAYAQLLHYSSKYLIELIQKLRRKKIYIGIKWRKYWYIFLPDYAKLKSPSGKTNPTELPGGQQIDVDQEWREAIEELPQLDPLPKPDTDDKDREPPPPPLNYTINEDGGLGVIVSSTLTPKTVTPIVGVQNATYRATTEYSYGNYIFYDPNMSSTFDPGTSGSLKSTQIPQAFFEICRFLDAAENTRNGANPGLAPRRNLSTTVSFDAGTVAVAATIPIVTTIEAGGAIKISGSDYLGSTYSTFANGGGDLISTNIVAAFLELGSLLAAAEKAVTPVENQPNNIQIVIDTEAGNATVSANLPFTTAAATNGDVTIQAIDYL